MITCPYRAPYIHEYLPIFRSLQLWLITYIWLLIAKIIYPYRAPYIHDYLPIFRSLQLWLITYIWLLIAKIIYPYRAPDIHDYLPILCCLQLWLFREMFTFVLISLTIKQLNWLVNVYYILKYGSKWREWVKFNEDQIF